MEAQQVSSAVQIYKIFSKKGFTEEEAGIIATAPRTEGQSRDQG